jgi:hypothetical protein
VLPPLQGGMTHAAAVLSPPWAVACPLTMSAWTVMRVTARPGTASASRQLMLGSSSARPHHRIGMIVEWYGGPAAPRRLSVQLWGKLLRAPDGARTERMSAGRALIDDTAHLSEGAFDGAGGDDLYLDRDADRVLYLPAE